MSLYFINTNEYVRTREIRTFESEKQRSEFAPEFNHQVELPEGFSWECYTLDLANDVWVYTPSTPTLEEQLTERDRRLAEAALRIAPLQDAVDLGLATESEQEKLLEWKAYRIELMRLPESSSWPTEPEWPVTPEA